MSIIIPANTLASGGFEVDNSCRFEQSSGAYMHKTPSSAGNRQKWTFSFWLKLTADINHYIFSSGTAATDRTYINFNDGALAVQNRIDSSNVLNLITNALHRDTAAWFHFVVAIDTTQGTAANRAKCYVNGTQITSFATETYPNQNVNTFVNNTQLHTVGKPSWTDSAYYDGYMAEVVHIDGQQLAPDQFGEFDEDSGIWKPIKVSGLTFGTNGFYLEFKGAGTSANSSGLGADTSGNTHHFTVGNLTAVDQSIDTCTNNFCTLNSVDKGFGSTVYTEGNLNATSSSGWNPSRGTIAVTKGKWYWEIVSGNSFQVGVCNDTIDFANNDNAQDLTGVTVFYNGSGGIIRTNGSTVGGTTATVDANDMVGFALDMDNKKLSVYKNGSIIVTNTSLSTSITDVAMIFGTTDGGGDFKINFGSPMYAISSGNQDGNGFGNFEYAVPSGYFALCTKNLAENG